MTELALPLIAVGLVALVGLGAITHALRAPQARRDPTESELQQVALAAFAFHRSRRAPDPSSPTGSMWSSAGRMRQLARFRR
ncbi:MAG TPA: hypothetical protein VEC18_00180 [Myxococcota bacterium]|nr:hypothetical protein [Myxococcota bacterium]